MDDDFFYLGKVVRAKGIKGELIVFIDADNPKRYNSLHGVFIKTRQGYLPYIIEHIDIDDKGWGVLKFLNINDRTAVTNLTRKEMFLPIAMLPKLSDGEFYFHEIIGFAVHDVKYGFIGHVKSVMQQTMHPILKIIYESKEILIPLNNQIIEKVNKVDKVISIKAPEGLIELYLKT